MEFCSLWKKTKENLIEKINSPTVTRQEVDEALWVLYGMFAYEKKNPNEFVERKRKTIGAILNPSLNVLGRLAKSHGNPCEL